MGSAVELLREERRRKLRVRESFRAGLARFRNGQGEAGRFYLACADYLVAGQRRLIDQDRRLVDILAPQVPAEQAEDHATMQALRGRLDLANDSLGDFEQAVQAYRRAGAAGQAAFESAADRFIDLLVNVLGARSHALQHLTRSLLKDEDWQRIVAVTPESTAAEAARYAEVSSTAPAGMGPDEVDVTPRAPAAG